MLPSSSWTIAPVRIICAPTECWVQPQAYMMVSDLARLGGLGDFRPDLEHRVPSATADIAHHVRGVAAVVLLEQVEHAAQVGQVGSTLAQPSSPISLQEDLSG